MIVPKYSILLMRDDSRVKRFRLSPAWLKTFVYLLILLIALGIGGIVVGVKFWQGNNTLLAENKDLRKRLAGAKVQLERLENVQQILAQQDIEEVQSLYGSMNIETSKPELAPPVDLGELFDKVDLHQVKVTNLQARLGSSTMRVYFELNNQSDRRLAGLVSVALVTNNGNIIQVAAGDSDLSFSINRFKRVRVRFSLPKGVSKNDVFGVRLDIQDNDGNTIFTETYPLFSIVS
jgi:hypothetical protein